MRSDRRHRGAFVIQLDPDADPRGGRFEGRVEHVASGASARFAGADELLAFLGRAIADQRDPDDADGVVRACEEPAVLEPRDPESGPPSPGV